MPIYEEKIKKNGKSIPKLVDGKKQYYIRTYIEDEFGNSKQITRHNKKWLGKDGKIEANREENRLKKQQLIKEKINKSITLLEAKNLYLSYVKPTVDNDTFKTKETKLNHFCEIDATKQVKTYPNKPLNFFTKELYQIWKEEMKKKKYPRGKDEKGRTKWHLYSVKHLNNTHNEICLLFDYLVENGYCQYNIAKQAGKIGTSKEIKMSKMQKNYTTIDYEEYKKLMIATKDNPKYNTIFDLWFSRGPRAGEMRAFRIKDYSYERKQLMVNHSLSKTNELKEPKTASSKAPIDLDDVINEKINNLVNQLKKKSNFNENWYIFNGEKPISSHALDYNKDKFFKIAGINKHLRLHDFRHSCATWLFSIGIPITVISKILRHNDISVTMSTYTHLVQQDYTNALNTLNTLKQDQK